MVVFNAIREGYICFLKRFVFCMICRLYLIQFLSKICMEKMLELVLGAFFCVHTV